MVCEGVLHTPILMLTTRNAVDDCVAAKNISTRPTKTRSFIKMLLQCSTLVKLYHRAR